MWGRSRKASCSQYPHSRGRRCWWPTPAGTRVRGRSASIDGPTVTMRRPGVIAGETEEADPAFSRIQSPATPTSWRPLWYARTTTLWVEFTIATLT